MTATALPAPTAVTEAGVTVPTPVATDAVNGNTMLNDGHTYLDVVNTDTVTHTLTIHFAQLVRGQSVTPIVKTITAGVAKRYGKLPVKEYGGKLLITVDSALLHVSSFREG